MTSPSILTTDYNTVSVTTHLTATVVMITLPTNFTNYFLMMITPTTTTITDPHSNLTSVSNY